MKEMTRRTALLSLAALTKPWRAFGAPFRLFSWITKDKGARIIDELKLLNELQLALVNLRFGMFIHFSPTTYLDPPDQLMPDHAPPRQGRDGVSGTSDDLSASLVNPVHLDCNQWAKVAASAKMKFAVLTTKHHDGFCLWPSKFSSYTVAQGCKRDIVGEFASAFRKQGLKVGFYYSIRDRTERIAGDLEDGGVSTKKIEFIKNQLSELLTNYGEILYIVFDGWGNVWHESPTFSEIPYSTIYNHIKSIQPKCLILNHSRIRYVSDVPHLELRAGMKFPTERDWPAVGGDTLQPTWFWRKSYSSEELKSVDWIVNQNLIPDNKRNVVFQLNCAPNRDGLMDDNVVTRMSEVGMSWSPPTPLKTVPDSWKGWPIPPSLHFFSGKNIARGKPVRISPEQGISGSPLVDGDPDTSVDLSGSLIWIEIDLGQIYQLAGLHLWNRAPVQNVMLEKGFVFVSEHPISFDDPADIQTQPGVTSIPIPEPPGYPTPYPIGARGRYLRVVSTSGQQIGIGEIEVFANDR